MPKNLIIIGSTGNIGTQALEVVRENPSDFTVVGLAAHSNQEKLDQQILEFNPKYGGTLCSKELTNMVTQSDVDVILFACSSADHLDVLKAAIKAEKHIAIANKEIIVEHGEEIMPLIHNATFVPVDSEHSAIFQILQNRDHKDIEKITLTCSGGSLYNEDLENITLEQATSHPKWDMGQKITIDSATLMNKAIEIIEAKYLFDLEPDQIEVLVHPECIVHGIVHFKDGTSIAHMGYPDMKIPISYALYYPEVKQNTLPRVDLKNQTLTFLEPNTDKFPSIDFAYNALRLRGDYPKKLSRANNKAVEKFTQGEIKFKEIFNYISKIF
ncbi:1-deoxy-D-xylulose-5-phosphate reductoisomerase [Patescibacteria group bacterium]